MATVKQVVGTKTALTVTGLATLASGTYVTSAVYNNTTNQPLDVMVEAAITPGTTTGNKQAVIFAQASYDNSVFQSGPGSGTTTTDESDLTLVGVVPLNTAAGAQVKSFSTALAYGGVLPPYVRYVVKNDSGVAFTNGALNTAEISATVA